MEWDMSGPVTQRSAHSPEMETRLILAAGMQRSGSTWLYNAARLILEDNCPEDERWAGWVGHFDANVARANSLLKVHDFDYALADMADVTLYCYRDIRDVIASASRVWNTVPSFEMAETLVDQFAHWMEVQDLVIRYDEILSQPDQVIGKIARTLGYDVDCRHVMQRLAGLSYDSPGPRDAVQHAVNLYHPGHVTDGGHGTWSPYVDGDLIRRIEEHFADWFNRYSYLPLSAPVDGR